MKITHWIMGGCLMLTAVPACADGVPVPVHPVPGNIVVNGDFRQIPPDASDHGTPQQAGSTSIAGWTVGAPCSSFHDNLGVVNLQEAGVITQMLNTVPGQTYELTFYMSGVPRGPAIKVLECQFGDATTTFRLDSNTTNDFAHVWQLQRATFKATGRQQALRLQSRTGEWHGPLISEISVAPLSQETMLARTLQPLYDIYSRCLTRHDARYFATMIADDYAVQKAGQTVTDRAAMLKSMQDAATSVGSDHVQIKAVQAEGDHVTVDAVETLELTSGDHPQKYVRTVRDTWVQTPGGDYRWARREIQSEQHFVDGQEQTP